MTPMTNYGVGSFSLTMNTIVHGTTLIHLGKFVREEYIGNMIKYKVNIIENILILDSMLCGKITLSSERRMNCIGMYGIIHLT